MYKRVFLAAALATATLMSGCEATMMSQRLDYHEMQGVAFMTDREEDAILGNPQIVHRAYNPHSRSICARVVGHPWVIVPSGQTSVIAYQSAYATSASHEVGPVNSRGGCS